MSSYIPISGLDVFDIISPTDFVALVDSSSLTTYRTDVQAFLDLVAGSGSVISASWANRSFSATSASFTNYSATAFSASWASRSFSSTSASFADFAPTAFSASWASRSISSTISVTSSVCTTASFAISASFSPTASFAISASFANVSVSSSNSITSSYSETSSFANRSVSSSFASSIPTSVLSQLVPTSQTSIFNHNNPYSGAVNLNSLVSPAIPSTAKGAIFTLTTTAAVGNDWTITINGYVVGRGVYSSLVTMTQVIVPFSGSYTPTNTVITASGDGLSSHDVNIQGYFS